MIVVDSDILIWILRGEALYQNKLRTAVEDLGLGFFITPIQFMEIMSGLREKEVVNTELFLDSFQVISIGRDSGKLAGYFLNKYKKSHHLHNADVLIAAAVKINNFLLWTNNKKHYPMLSRAEFF